MSGPVAPDGGAQKPSRAVFVRRRVAVLLGLIAIVAAVALMIIGPQTVAGWFGGGVAGPPPEDAPVVVATDTEESAETADSADKSTAESAEPGPCDPSALVVEAATDTTSYASGQRPQLSLRVTNQGDVACDADLGTQTMSFQVHSGPELYWNSTDCQSNAESNPVRMAAGETLESDALEWDRTRSSPETCDIERTPVPAGGASYHLSAEIAGVTSQQSTQFLLY